MAVTWHLQGETEDFAELQSSLGNRLMLYLNADIRNTFHTMVSADALCEAC